MFATKRLTRRAAGRGKRGMMSMGNGLAYKMPAVDTIGQAPIRGALGPADG